MEKFSTDKISLYAAASAAVNKFHSLVKIKDETTIFLWDEYVPETVIVEHFWKVFDELMKNDGLKYKNCMAEVIYQPIHQTKTYTGLRLVYITDYQRLQIEKENQETLAKYLNK